MTENTRLSIQSPIWNSALRGGMIGFGLCAVAVGAFYPPALALALLPIGWYGVARLLDAPIFDPADG